MADIAMLVAEEYETRVKKSRKSGAEGEEIDFFSCVSVLAQRLDGSSWIKIRKVGEENMKLVKWVLEPKSPIEDMNRGFHIHITNPSLSKRYGTGSREIVTDKSPPSSDRCRLYRQNLQLIAASSPTPYPLTIEGDVDNFWYVANKDPWSNAGWPSQENSVRCFPWQQSLHVGGHGFSRHGTLSILKSFLQKF
ncbi:hypothetical protein F0562_003297 [Nyssa sinensis]|uniref:Uncharacterized protein n=1 Tax=Nyssa sinensis TaxID=561372 RepID=A0A5J5BVM6_9ASTE|nr:hypothetical protein F0562_003297 [Nyssa sinensis]